MEDRTTFHLKGQMASRRVWLNGRELLAEKSLMVVNHSPDGFNWGYGGSGPAQLSLAICLELFPDSVAKSIYQSFKWQIVSTLPQSDFEKEIDLFEFLANNQEQFVHLRKRTVEEAAWKEEDRIVIAEMAATASEEGYTKEETTSNGLTRHQFYDPDGYKAFWYETQNGVWTNWSF